MSRLATAPLGAKCAASRPSPSASFAQAAPRLVHNNRRTLSCSCNTRLADQQGEAAPAPAAVPAVQYFSAGQSWCRFSVMQRDLLASAAQFDRVTYVDCTRGSDTASHPACLVKDVKGFPYLARCEEGKDCDVVKYGMQSLDQLTELSRT